MKDNEHAHTEAAPSAEEEHNITPGTDSLVPNIDNGTLLPSNLLEMITAGDFEKVKEILDQSPHLVKARYTFQFEYGTEFGADKQEGITPLIQAAAYPETRTLELFLQKGADANEKTTSHGSSPLHMAARFGHWENFKLLIDSGAKIDSRTKSQRTVLHQAAFSSDIRFCNYILNLDGADANVVDDKNCTPIYIAVQEGHSSVVELLIQHEADVNIAYDDGATALHIATQKGHSEIVKQLLSRSDADVNATNNAGVSALFMAAQKGHPEIVKRLLPQSGIDVNIKSRTGVTALIVAAYKGHTEVVGLLLAYSPGMFGKRVNRNAVTTEDGWSAIVVAAIWGHTEVFNKLISDDEVDLTISDCDGLTVLYYALNELPHEDALRVLKAPSYFPDEPLETKLCCAGPNEHSSIKDALYEILEKEIGRPDIESILFWAVINGAQDLLEKGLKHNRLDSNHFLRGNKVPLHVAARLGNWEVIQILVDNGADVDSLATHNSMAIHLAAENGHLTTVEKLLNMPTRASSDEVTSLSKQLQRIIREDINGNSAISLAVGKRNKSVEEFLWKEFKIHGNLHFTSSPSHEEKEKILEIAAKYERPGEESVLESFLQRDKPSPYGWTVLHWAVSESQPVVVWWLLSKGGYVKTKTLEEVRELQNRARNPSETRNPSDEIIQGLLHNPPPILPSVSNNDDNELVQKPSLADYDDLEYQGTIVDFYGVGENIEMHFNQKFIKEIIYQQGVKKLMEESRKRNIHNLNFIKQAVQGGQTNRTVDLLVQQTPKRPNAPEGLSQIRQKVNCRAFDPTVTQMTGDVGGSKERRFSGAPVFRWIHIPLNDMNLLEDLVTRISADEKKTQKDFRPLMQFLQETWTPCAVGGDKHYMKPQFVKEDTRRETKALYIPYLALSKRPGGWKVHKGSSKKTGLPIHGTMTLNQYYYVALTGTKTRSNGQVLSRYFDHYPPHLRKTLVVGDLWLWIIDNKTMITATTDHPDFVNTVFNTITSRERSARHLLPKSVNDMMELVLGIQIAYITQENLPSDKGPRSVLNVFRDFIRDVAERETQLYDSFLKSINPESPKPASSRNNILKEVRILREIKAIRNELGILVALVEEQKTVWEQVFPSSKSPNNGLLDGCTPNMIREDLSKMIADADLVLGSINSLLDLTQKQATIQEAEWGRKQQGDTSRQSNIMMVFTVVTIIFLPLSFLSSLFALNVSEFPHKGESVAFKGRWIFPMIFGISAAVSFPLIWVAFNVNSLLDWFQDDMQSEPERPELRMGLETWHPGEHARSMLRKQTIKGRIRNLRKRPQLAEDGVLV